MKVLCRLVVVFLMVLMVAMFAGCSPAEKAAVYKEEGGAYAYNKYKGKQILLASAKSVEYYVGSLTGDYLTAAEDACKKISATSKGVNIVSTKVKKSVQNFTMTTYSLKDKTSIGSANAYNSYSVNESTIRIVKSQIKFNTAYMNNFSKSAKYMLAKHELGHTLGLKDFYKGSLVFDNDATIMKGTYAKGMTIISNYTEFDQRCIKDYYGE